MNINLPPPPVYFIKSISEQGYSLSTAIADLIDNSIAAGASRVEILIDTNNRPLKLYVADDGKGMESDELTENMRFPSADLDLERGAGDLGRFGLGLKTASFSQARKFTVISKLKGSTDNYEGRTWDVEYLKTTNNEWTLIVESHDRVTVSVDDFNNLSGAFHSFDPQFVPQTLIVWNTLYKIEKLKTRTELNDEIEELRNHLSLVFHRFIANKKLCIRLNNSIVPVFDPFPVHETDVQSVSESYWQVDNGFIKFQGIILPKRALEESKSEESNWNISGKSLEELQGIYVYRNDRLINYGGWLRSIPRSIQLQFGRVRVDISSLNDALFHINVAKASLKIPFSLKKAMADMIGLVARQAGKEYRERIVSNVIRSKVTSSGLSLISKDVTSVGPILRINTEFELIRQLKETLGIEEVQKLDIIFDLLEKKLNQIWKGESGSTEIESEIYGPEKDKITNAKKYYEQLEYSSAEIESWLMETYGNSNEKREFIKSLFN